MTAAQPARSVPIPHDPRVVASPGTVDETIAEILGAPVASLREEFEQLDCAHAVLRDALKEN